MAKTFALDLASTKRAVGPFNGLPCPPIQFRFKDHHRQGTSQAQGCQHQSAQLGCILDLLKERRHRRGFIKDLGQNQFGHRIDRFSMKDVAKIFFYVSLRVLRSYNIVQSESRYPPTFIYALGKDISIYQ